MPELGDSTDLGRYSFDPGPITAPPASGGVPNRGTSEQALDAWNQRMRSSSVYQAFMRSRGRATDGRVKLSRQEQKELEQALARAGMPVPNGMQIDQGGNLNQKNRLGRNVAIGAAATGAALTGFGLAGMGPLSGLASGGVAATGMGGLPAGMAPGGAMIGGSVTAPLAGASAATTAATTGAKMGMSKLWPTIVGAGGDALTSLGAIRSAGRNRDFQRELTNKQLAQELALANLTDRRVRDISGNELALDESKLNPFRELMAQIAAAERLDRLLNTAPLELDFSNSRPGSFAPVTRGGAANYRPSDDLRTAAANARSATLQGQGATRVTAAAQARQLLDLLAASRTPNRPPVSSTMPIGGRPGIQPGAPPQSPGVDDVNALALNGQPQPEDPFALSIGNGIRPPAPRPLRRRGRMRFAA